MCSLFFDSPDNVHFHLHNSFIARIVWWRAQREKLQKVPLFFMLLYGTFSRFCLFAFNLFSPLCWVGSVSAFSLLTLALCTESGNFFFLHLNFHSFEKKRFLVHEQNDSDFQWSLRSSLATMKTAAALFSPTHFHNKIFKCFRLIEKRIAFLCFLLALHCLVCSPSFSPTSLSSSSNFLFSEFFILSQSRYVSCFAGKNRFALC